MILQSQTPSPSDEEIEKGFAEFVKMILNDKE